MTANILYNEDVIQKHKLLKQYKRALAIRCIHTKLQLYLNDINDIYIRCGCNSCIDEMAPNYPDTEANTEINENGDVTKYKSSFGDLKVAEDTCLLFEFFNQCCKHFLPESNLGDSLPRKWPRNFDLTTCLGLPSNGWDEPQRFYAHVISSEDSFCRFNRMIFYLWFLAEHTEDDLLPISSIIYDDNYSYVIKNERFVEWFQIDGLPLL